MQHSSPKLSSSTLEVFDVVAVCRSQKIDERDVRKLVRVVGRFATRLEIQMNLTKRRARFR